MLNSYEIQKAKQNFFKDRSVYYATFPIQEQAKKGNWDYRLEAVYTVGILDFVFDEDKHDPEVRHEVKLKDKHCEVFYDNLTFIYLEMPKFQKTEEELVTTFDKWMYVLKQLPYLQDRPVALQERIFHKLFEAAEIARFDPKEKAQYEESLKYYRDLKNVVDTSYEEGLVEGRQEGDKKGIEEGHKKGIEEGHKKGIEEGKIAVILTSHRAGLDPETIAKITGKSVDEVERIIREKGKK